MLEVACVAICASARLGVELQAQLPSSDAFRLVATSLPLLLHLGRQLLEKFVWLTRQLGGGTALPSAAPTPSTITAAQLQYQHDLVGRAAVKQMAAVQAGIQLLREPGGAAGALVLAWARSSGRPSEVLPWLTAFAHAMQCPASGEQAVKVVRTCRHLGDLCALLFLTKELPLHAAALAVVCGASPGS